MNSVPSIGEELQRVRRVSDSLCTAHAVLRDRFSRRALGLDLLVLGLSTWLVALAFVEPTLGAKLTPFGWDSQIWIGVLATATFFLTILQLKTDWKAKADAHRRTLELYAEVKREAGYAIASDELDDTTCRRVLSRYDLASAVGIEVPEADFLKLKKKHRIKVVLSKHLDKHPSASLIIVRLKLWFNDNIGSERRNV
jgi:hypothetical protein